MKVYLCIIVSGLFSDADLCISIFSLRVRLVRVGTTTGNFTPTHGLKSILLFTPEIWIMILAYFFLASVLAMLSYDVTHTMRLFQWALDTLSTELPQSSSLLWIDVYLDKYDHSLWQYRLTACPQVTELIWKILNFRFTPVSQNADIQS